MTDDYNQRATQYRFASKETIQQALKDPNAVVLDVRKEDEIVVDGHFDTTAKWTHTSCTPTACPLLEKAPELLLPNKNGKKRDLSVFVDVSDQVTSFSNVFISHAILRTL